MPQFRVPELDTFNWQQNVLSQTATPPGSPAKGDRYIVGASATGVWATHDDDIAWCSAAAGPTWAFNTPVEGWTVWDENEGAYYYFDGAGWVVQGNDKPTKISTNTTVYVSTTGSDVTGDGTSGNPFATPQQALTYLNGFYIDSGVTVTISLADGYYSLTTTIQCAHPQGKQITIAGTTTYSKTLSSIQSSAGAGGAWTYIVNLTSVANIAVGDAILIPGSVTGGTRPTHLAGCYIISNVDVPNSRVTFASAHKYATASSGAVTGTVTIVKTKITSTASFIITLNNLQYLGALEKIVLVGSGSTAGIRLVGKSQIIVQATTVGISTCTIGAWVSSNSTFIYDGYISDCTTYCILAEVGSLTSSYASAGVFTGSTYGIRLIFGSTSNHIGATVSGCTTGHSGSYTVSGQIWNNIISGCTTGVYCEYGGVFVTTTNTYSDNGANETAGTGGTII